jgi:hypothetical protein
VLVSEIDSSFQNGWDGPMIQSSRKRFDGRMVHVIIITDMMHDEYCSGLNSERQEKATMDHVAMHDMMIA